MASFYIYYRVAAGQEALARQRVQALQRQLLDVTGMRGRLLVKRGDPSLWMEVYEGVADPPAFERALAASVSAAHLESVLVAGAHRQIECFED